MMSRHFRLRLELIGAIAKRVPNTKNQLSAPGCFFNQFVTDLYIYIYIYYIYIYIYSIYTYTNIYIHNNRVLIVRIHSIKISAFYHLKWLSYGRKTEISIYKKVTMTS